MSLSSAKNFDERSNFQIPVKLSDAFWYMVLRSPTV